MSLLDKKVSYFQNHSSVETPVNVNLLQLLTSGKHRIVIERLRNVNDEKEQKRIKDTLPCYTVAGVFSSRNKNGLILPSKLACVDLDCAEDYDLYDLTGELKRIPYIAYCGLSCRGRRLFCIVPFATENYGRHYERLIQSFDDMGLPMGDNCHRVISQPRYVSYNDATTHWFNHSAQPYKLLSASITNNIPENNAKHLSLNNSFTGFSWCVTQINKTHSFTKGNRHHYLVSLARYCNLKGLAIELTMTNCIGFAEDDFEEREIRDIVDYIYREQRASHGLRPFLTRNGEIIGH